MDWPANPNPKRKAPVSSPEQFVHTCTECRKLIAQQLEAREQLARAIAHSPDGPAVAVLRDKVRKLAAHSEAAFLKAMNALPSSRA